MLLSSNLLKNLWKKSELAKDEISIWIELLSLIFDTTQKMKFSITDFFSKCDQIRRKLRILSHLLKESMMESSFFVQCNSRYFAGLISWISDLNFESWISCTWNFDFLVRAINCHSKKCILLGFSCWENPKTYISNKTILGSSNI